jgi:hypothetical protein
MITLLSLSDTTGIDLANGDIEIGTFTAKNNLEAIKFCESHGGNFVIKNLNNSYTFYKVKNQYANQLRQNLLNHR